MTEQQVIRQVSLLVNNNPIEIEYFVQEFIYHVISGMMEMLEGAGPVKTLELYIDGDRVKIVHNGNAIAINPFVTKIIRGTVTGMVSSLKGVSDIKTVNISINKASKL